MLKILLTLASGEAAARAFHVLAFLLLARTAGKEALGQLGFALAVTSYLLLTVQQAFDTVAIREVSREPALLKRFAAGILGLRLATAGVVSAGLFLYIAIAGFDRIEHILLAVLSVSYFSGAVTLKWPFQALEQPKPIAIASLLTQLCFFAGVLFVRDASQLVWAAVAQVAGEIAGAGLLWAAVWKKHGRIFPRADIQLWKDLFRDSWPMSICAVLCTMLYNFDTLALGFYGYRAELGLYLAAYRCVTMFTLVLGLIQVSAFPRISRTYPDQAATGALAMRLVRYSTAGMFAASAMLTLGAGVLLGLLYGDPFREGAIILQVLAWTLPVQAARMMFRLVVFAYHQQRQDTMNVLWGVLVNVVLDLVFIPRFGVMACAFSSLAAEIVVLAGTYVSYVKTIQARQPMAERSWRTGLNRGELEAPGTPE